MQFLATVDFNIQQQQQVFTTSVKMTGSEFLVYGKL